MAMTSQPNVLFIGVDQMRADTPGYAGNPLCQTPTLDRLAGEGASFTRAYAPSSQCTPSRASMLTGRYAFHHGMGTNCDMYHAMNRELPDPGQLLHRRLQDAGYRCGFVGKWHVGAERGPTDYGFEGMNLPGYGDLKQDAGFHRYLRENDLSYGPLIDPIYGNPNENTLLAGRWNGPLESTPTHYLANYTMEMLDRYAAGDDPFFLTCQFWAPHPPYLPSPEYAGRHDRSAIPPWANFEDDYDGKPASIARFRPNFYRSLPDDWAGWREIVGLYYDYTTLVDAEIGRVLQHLDDLGLADETIVVFTSDHGDMTGSHGGLFDKGFIYEEAHHVPLIVRWPDEIEGGRVSDELVYNMDILPTVLDVLGQPDTSLDGQSLLPHLRDEPAAGRDSIYLESHGMRYLYSQRALITRDGLKYVFTPGDFDELYDLDADPGEVENLLDDGAPEETVRRLRRELKRIAAGVDDPIRDYIAKLFGDWDNVSDQPDASDVSIDG